MKICFEKKDCKIKKTEITDNQIDSAVVNVSFIKSRDTSENKIPLGQFTNCPAR